MNDRELADAIVTLGVGKDIRFGLGEANVERFVRDWRVAGACMERVLREQPMNLSTVMISYHPTIDWFEASIARSATNAYGTYLDNSDKDSAPRAIIEACLRALGELE